MTATFTPLQIANQCRLSGSSVTPLPAGVDGAQLLWAISGNESSFGANCTPRHEPAFDAGGVYGDDAAMKPLLAKYGTAAAYSYGPWQMLFCNAPAGYAPPDMLVLSKAAWATVTFLNELLRRWKPQTMAAIGETWNAGHPLVNLSAGVARYVAELVSNYAVPMPD